MPNQVVSSEEWLVARVRRLEKEKEFSRLRDELTAERRALPWVQVDKEYIFDGPDGLSACIGFSRRRFLTSSAGHSIWRSAFRRSISRRHLVPPTR